LKIESAFVRSAAGAADLPQDSLGVVALVGRSNVGKSSLINALVRQRLARTSSAPGKTRLGNVYLVLRGAAQPFYVVDLPGYGYARRSRDEGDRGGAGFDDIARAVFARSPAALLLVDARHPGLQSDAQAWAWLASATPASAVVATKIDKLSRAERQRAMQTNEAVFERPVLPFSAETGEGLDELWKLIDRLLNNRQLRPRNPMAPNRTAPAASPPRRPRKS
jgi:GTP-binding protein